MNVGERRGCSGVFRVTAGVKRDLKPVNWVLVKLVPVARIHSRSGLKTHRLVVHGDHELFLFR